MTTRTYQDRLDTLAAVRDAGMSTCCGGIVGMGETRRDRAGMPLGDSTPVDGLEFVRMIAVARLVCPKAMVRIAAGREHMSKELQALCFFAGANSIFVVGRLLTTNNPEKTADEALLADLKMRAMGQPVA